MNTQQQTELMEVIFTKPANVMPGLQEQHIDGMDMNEIGKEIEERVIVVLERKLHWRNGLIMRGRV